MVIKIIIENDNGNQIKNTESKSDKKLKEASCKIGCNFAELLAQTMFEDIDEKLYLSRKKRSKSNAFSKRSYVTRFGDITICRRLYEGES